MSELEDRRWTPGPWQANVRARNTADWPNSFDVEATPPALPGMPPPARVHICFVRTWGGFGAQRADARLIAAAPDLYEALSRLVMDIASRYTPGTAGFSVCVEDDPLMVAACQALAKAHGVKEFKWQSAGT